MTCITASVFSVMDINKSEEAAASTDERQQKRLTSPPITSSDGSSDAVDQQLPPIRDRHYLTPSLQSSILKAHGVTETDQWSPRASPSIRYSSTIHTKATDSDANVANEVDDNDENRMSGPADALLLPVEDDATVFSAAVGHVADKSANRNSMTSSRDRDDSVTNKTPLFQSEISAGDDKDISRTTSTKLSISPSAPTTSTSRTETQVPISVMNDMISAAGVGAETSVVSRLASFVATMGNRRQHEHQTHQQQSVFWNGHQSGNDHLHLAQDRIKLPTAPNSLNENVRRTSARPARGEVVSGKAEDRLVTGTATANGSRRFDDVTSGTSDAPLDLSTKTADRSQPERHASGTGSSISAFLELADKYENSSINFSKFPVFSNNSAGNDSLSKLQHTFGENSRILDRVGYPSRRPAVADLSAGSALMSTTSGLSSAAAGSAAKGAGIASLFQQPASLAGGDGFAAGLYETALRDLTAPAISHTGNSLADQSGNGNGSRSSMKHTLRRSSNPVSSHRSHFQAEITGSNQRPANNGEFTTSDVSQVSTNEMITNDGTDPVKISAASISPSSATAAVASSSSAVRRMVRGQDAWMNGSGQLERRSSVLRCLECGLSFWTLPELTVHMIRTAHYANIIRAPAATAAAATGNSSSSSNQVSSQPGRTMAIDKTMSSAAEVSCSGAISGSVGAAIMTSPSISDYDDDDGDDDDFGSSAEDSAARDGDASSVESGTSPSRRTDKKSRFPVMIARDSERSQSGPQHRSHSRRRKRRRLSADVGKNDELSSDSVKKPKTSLSETVFGGLSIDHHHNSMSAAAAAAAAALFSPPGLSLFPFQMNQLGVVDRPALSLALQQHQQQSQEQSQQQQDRNRSAESTDEHANSETPAWRPSQTSHAGNCRSSDSAQSSSPEGFLESSSGSKLQASSVNAENGSLADIGGNLPSTGANANSSADDVQSSASASMPPSSASALTAMQNFIGRSLVELDRAAAASASMSLAGGLVSGLPTTSKHSSNYGGSSTASGYARSGTAANHQPPAASQQSQYSNDRQASITSPKMSLPTTGLPLPGQNDFLLPAAAAAASVTGAGPLDQLALAQFYWSPFFLEYLIATSRLFGGYLPGAPPATMGGVSPVAGDIQVAAAAAYRDLMACRQLTAAAAAAAAATLSTTNIPLTAAGAFQTPEVTGGSNTSSSVLPLSDSGNQDSIRHHSKGAVSDSPDGSIHSRLSNGQVLSQLNGIRPHQQLNTVSLGHGLDTGSGSSAPQADLDERPSSTSSGLGQNTGNSTNNVSIGLSKALDSLRGFVYGTVSPNSSKASKHSPSSSSSWKNRPSTEPPNSGSRSGSMQPQDVQQRSQSDPSSFVPLPTDLGGCFDLASRMPLIGLTKAALQATLDSATLPPPPSKPSMHSTATSGFNNDNVISKSHQHQLPRRQATSCNMNSRSRDTMTSRRSDVNSCDQAQPEPETEATGNGGGDGATDYDSRFDKYYRLARELTSHGHN